MEEMVKTLKSVSLNDVEAAIAEALSKLTVFPPTVDIRAFEVVKDSIADTLTHETYRFELKVRVPKREPSDNGFGF